MLKAAPRPLVVTALAIAALIALDYGGLHLLDPLERRFGDALTRRVAERLAPDPDIVIVDIDEASLARMQDSAGRWPWPRAVHAELLAGLLAQQPRAVVFDILFAEPDVFRPDSDALFRAAVRGQARVYLPTLRLDPAADARGVALADVATPLGLQRTPAAQPNARAQLLPPLVVDPADWRTGAINFAEDADGVGRRYWIALNLYGWQLPSLPARVARDFGWVTPPGDAVELHFRGDAGAFPRVPYADLYEDFGRRNRTRPTDELRDKILIIGTSAGGLHDARVTPLASLYPGVEILATAIDNLKNRRWMTRLASEWGAAFALALVALLTVAFVAQVNALWLGAALLLLSTAAVGAAYVALQSRVIVPVAVPLTFAWLTFVVGALISYLRERRARAQTVGLFRRFLNPEVVRRLVERGETIESLSGQTHTVSVLFSDIRGFTALSETRSPAAVVQLLNRYFERQVEVVFRNGGTLDKFIGDCIMAFWGAPLQEPQHARRAIEAALQMEQVLLSFRAELHAELGDAAAAFDVGIGIHSGAAVVGFIGAQRKIEYTAIGDTVNLASRIEGLTKEAGCRILVSRETMAAYQAQAADDEMIDFVEHGSYKAKGRVAPVELYEPRRLSR